MAKALTDRKLKALERKPAEPGKRTTLSTVWCLGLRFASRRPAGARSCWSGAFLAGGALVATAANQGRTSRCYAGAPFRFRLRKERQFFSEVQLPTR